MPVNSQQLEEFEPRQVPKASSFHEVIPVPSVPDISLVFDNHAKSSEEVSLRSDRSRSQAVSYENMNKNDDNEPRTSKPIPVAPLPNESYAAWRARALKSHYERSKVFIDTVPRGQLNPHPDIAESAVSPYSRRETNVASELPVHGSIRQQSRAAASRGSLNLSNSVNHSKSSFEHSSFDVRSLEQGGSTGDFSRNVAYNDHRGFVTSVASKSVLPRENPALRRENSRDSVIQATFRNENCMENERKSSNGNTKSRKKDEGKNPCGSGEQPSPFSDSRESPKQEKSEKRDSLRDIYRIIQLQNEQIQSLQSQVERLLKKNLDDAKKSESPKPVKKDASTQCMEEVTKTTTHQASTASVGVVTCLVDLEEDSQIHEVNVKDQVQATHCQCEDCPTALSSAENESLPKGKKGRTISQNSSQKAISNMGTPSNQCNTSKIVPNMQLIIEENESDESLSSSDSVECVTPISSDAHAKNDRNHKSKRNATTDSVKRQHDPKKAGLHSPKNKENICTPPKAMVNLLNRQRGSSNGRHTPRREDLRRKNCHLGSEPSPKSRHNNEDDVTLTLNGVELPTVTDPHISPEPSIHVDMQDYQEFSDEQDGSSVDEDGYSSENESAGSNDKNTHQRRESGEQDETNSDSQGSWTFYDNVLGQVNKLLRNQNGNSCSNKTPNMRQNAEEVHNQFQNAQAQPGNALPTMEAVREATIQHLRQMGIDIPYNNGYTPPHLPVQNTAQAQRKGPIDHYGLAGRNLRERPPSETSLRMNALAMKYLSDEELASFEHLGVRKDPFQHEPAQFSEQQVPRLGRGVIGEVSSTDFTLYGMNGTNLSFTTLRYLQRYQLTPANGANPQGMWRNQPQYGNFPDPSNPNGMNHAKTSPGAGEAFLPFPRENPEMNPYMQGMENNLLKQSHTNREPLSRKVLQNNVQREMHSPSERVNQVRADKMKDNGMPAVTKAKRTRSKHPVDQLAKNHGRDMTAKGNLSPNGFRKAEKLAEDFGVLRESRIQSSNILDIEALRQQRKLL